MSSNKKSSIRRNSSKQETSATRAGSGALLHPAGGHGRVGAGNAGRGGVPLAGSRVGGSTAATSKAAGPAASTAAGAAAGTAASSKKSSAAASKGNEEDCETAGAATDAHHNRGAGQRPGGAQAEGPIFAGIQRQVPMTPGRQIYLEAYAPPPAPPSRWQEMVGIVWPAEVAQGARRLLTEQERSNKVSVSAGAAKLTKLSERCKARERRELAKQRSRQLQSELAAIKAQSTADSGA
ncbi:hypothetical protein ACLKA6_017943 [Drosophila palustris]